MERASLLVMFGLLVWFGSAIIRLENYHYASQIGMWADQRDLVVRDHCLNSKETRTHPAWHLLHGWRVL